MPPEEIEIFHRLPLRENSGLEIITIDNEAKIHAPFRSTATDVIQLTTEP